MSWVLITGAARKLGRKIALALAKDYAIAIHYKDSKREAEELQRQIQDQGGAARVIFGDFSSAQSLEDFLLRYKSEFTATKALINNASSYLFGSFLTTERKEAEDLLRCNFFAPYTLSQSLSSQLIAENGSIINIGVAGVNHLLSDMRTSFYSLSKLSLWMLTKSLAKELAPHKVRVNMVSPGYMEETIDHPKDLNQIPMKRLGSHEGIVRAIEFLLDPKNDYITGQNIEVSGGVRL